MDFKRFKTIKVDETTGNIEALPAKVTKQVAPATYPVAADDASVTTLYNDSDSNDGSFKEWSTWCIGDTMMVRWGKCGSKLQVKAKKFRNERLADSTMRKTIKSKRRKGYRDNQ